MASGEPHLKGNEEGPVGHSGVDENTAAAGTTSEAAADRQRIAEEEAAAAFAAAAADADAERKLAEAEAAAVAATKAHAEEDIAVAAAELKIAEAEAATAAAKNTEEEQAAAAAVAAAESVEAQAATTAAAAAAGVETEEEAAAGSIATAAAAAEVPHAAHDAAVAGESAVAAVEGDQSGADATARAAQPEPENSGPEPAEAPPPSSVSGSETVRYSSMGGEGDDLFETVLRWVSTVAGKPPPAPPLDEHAVHAHLKNGVLLCELINAIRPGSIKRIEKPMGPFQQRENIARFLTAATELGVEGHSLFLTGDLFEGTNIKQVCHCIFALGRACHSVEGYTGPTLGKPVTAKLGKHRESSFKVTTGEGLWGKSASQHRASAGSDARLRTASATGYMSHRSNRSSTEGDADPTVPRPT